MANEPLQLTSTWPEKIARLTGKQRDIAQAIATSVDTFGGCFRTAQDAETVGTLGWQEGMEIVDGFRPESDHYKAVAALVGDDNAAIARRLWERRSYYSYNVRWTLRYRSANKDYIPVAEHVSIVFSLIHGVAKGASIDTFLGDYEAERFPESIDLLHEKYLSQLLAMRLDEAPDADALLGRIAKILENDLEKKDTAHTKQYAFWLMIQGLQCCRRADAHALVGKLLLNKSIQKECGSSLPVIAIEGSREGFMHFYKTMLDNHLFQNDWAVERFNLWTGLAYKQTQSDALEQAARCAWQCLSDAGFRKESHDCGDPLRRYLALWADYQDNVDAAVASVNTRLADGVNRDKAASLLFLSKTPALKARVDAANAIVADSALHSDALLMGLAVRLLGNLNTRLNEHIPDFSSTPPLGGDNAILVSADDRRRIYGILKAILNTLPDTKSKSECHLDLGGRISLSYSGDGLISSMIAQAQRASTPVMPVVPKASACRSVTITPKDPFAETRAKWNLPANATPLPIRSDFVRDSLDDDPPGVNIRDDLCSYIDHMDDSKQPYFAWSFIRDGQGSLIQKETFMRLLTLENTRFDAWNYCAGIQLTEDEYRRIESMVKDGDAFTKKAVFIKLLTRDPDGLGRSIQRLLTSQDAVSCEVGKKLLDTMANRKDDPEYRQVYTECVRLESSKQ